MSEIVGYGIILCVGEVGAALEIEQRTVDGETQRKVYFRPWAR